VPFFIAQRVASAFSESRFYAVVPSAAWSSTGIHCGPWQAPAIPLSRIITSSSRIDRACFRRVAAHKPILPHNKQLVATTQPHARLCSRSA
jgi:hypothetical protein